MNVKEIIIIVSFAFAFVNVLQYWKNKCGDYTAKINAKRVSKPKAYWPVDFHSN